MKTHSFVRQSAVAIAVLLLLVSLRAAAHCDGMDGPVVKAAQQALAEENVNLTLIWVNKNDESEIKRVFEQTLAVRKLNSTARELADRHFFETVVRVHRLAEGAPYTGLKPAGQSLGAAIPAADRSLATGDIKPLRGLLSEEMGRGLQARFQAVEARKKHDKNDIKAGREFVRAYTEYIHYVEALDKTMRGCESDSHNAEPHK